MIKTLDVHQYKKLDDITISFTPGVNAISGTNGTCKTTILHMISNAYQAVDAKDSRLDDPSIMKAIRGFNAQVNTKIEKLAKGDKQYNDPAPEYGGGNLFEVEFFNNKVLKFRKHNSRIANRYAIKPYYKRGTSDKLPALPVIYLGLSRLLPWGEYQNDDSIKRTSFKAPENFYDELSELYRSMTLIEANSFATQNINNVRKRQDFDTENKGVDSNTISSGEDTILVILTALLSLKYYYQSLSESSKQDQACSVLLIDELDATLHPSLQFVILDLMQEFANEYKIQIIFTTHSIGLLNYMLKRKLNVIYLMDNINEVTLMEEPDPQKIAMYLQEKTQDDILSDKIIPVFTEDEEARLFYSLILRELQNASGGFTAIERNTHLVKANFGAEQLISLFHDEVIRKSSMSSMCILDGDHSPDMTHNIAVLPGDKSPEWVAFSYAEFLADSKKERFWNDKAIIDEGYSKLRFMKYIKPKIDELRASGSSERVAVKNLFNQNRRFFTFVLKAWIRNNLTEIKKFADDLSRLYRKTAAYHGIYVPKAMDI